LTDITHASKLSWGTKISYALGFTATTVEGRGTSSFLLIFYNQVVGLPPAMVSGVLLMLTILDCFLDPAIGHISDHVKSRWGRRHPFMYLAILPVSIAYVFLWCPPESWSEGMIFIYLVVVMVVLRIFGTMFELPSLALLPELTQDYNERTSVIALRTMFGLVGATLMTVLAYQVFLKESPSGQGGVLARDGYFHYGIACAVVIAGCMLTAALGTHKRIPLLSKPHQSSRPSLGAMWREVVATAKNPSFVALISTSVLMSIGTGTKIGLDLYFQLYFWQLRQTQLSVLLAAGVVGTVAAMVVAPWLARRLGKRSAAMFVLVGVILGNVLPVVLRLMGLMPANGTSLLFGILFVDVLYTYTMSAATVIYLSSMLNDVVEDIEVNTGYRSEGLLMAADNLCRKLVGGIGIFISGLILTVIAFPRQAERNAVDPETIINLAYAYIPITLCYLGAILAVSRYRIDRNQHEANLMTLRTRIRPPAADENSAADAVPGNAEPSKA